MMIRLGFSEPKIATVKDVVNKACQSFADPMKKMGKEETDTSEEEVVAEAETTEEEVVSEEETTQEEYNVEEDVNASLVVKNSPKNSEKRQGHL